MNLTIWIVAFLVVAGARNVTNPSVPVAIAYLVSLAALIYIPIKSFRKWRKANPNTPIIKVGGLTELDKSFVQVVKEVAQIGVLSSSIPMTEYDKAFATEIGRRASGKSSGDYPLTDRDRGFAQAVGEAATGLPISYPLTHYDRGLAEEMGRALAGKSPAGNTLTDYDQLKVDAMRKRPQESD